MSEPWRRKGVAASMGVAVGSAWVLGGGRRRLSFRRIDPSAVDEELARFRAAVSASRDEIEVARQELEQQHGTTYASILDVHLLMHGDALVIDAICDSVRHELVNAECAVTRVAERLKAPLLSDSSSYFRARAHDIDHVKEHLLRHLCGEDRAEASGAEPVVLITHDLTPADAAHLLGPPTVGLVTEVGAGSSHTAILARALGVPAVVGVGPLPLEIEDDQNVVVDGFSGEVVIGASIDECDQAEARRARFLSFLRAGQDAGAVTVDGVSVSVSANMELASEIEAALESAADGVGLYRTEFLCLDRQSPPSEEEQLEVYREVAAAMAPNKVVFRTFDWRGDKRPRGFEPPHGESEWLRAQVRAVMRAGAQGSVALMFPMICTVKELLRAKALVAECWREVFGQERGPGAMPVGMMVEVPAAALLADRFARHVDFFAVGTNDLAHYALAADRNDGLASAVVDPLDPALLELVARTVRAADDAGIPCSMCGDMAANPATIGLALGMGYRELSVPVRMVPLVRTVIRDLDSQVMASVVREALKCESSEDVRALLEDRVDGIDPLWIEHKAL